MTDELLERISKSTDTILKLLDEWDEPAVNGGISADLLFTKYEVEHQLTEARESLQKLMAAADSEYQRQQLPVKRCQCEGADNSLCSIHPVSHYHQEGCCDEPEDDHRNMTESEYDIAYPQVFDEIVQVEDGRYRLDARKYTSGVGVGITQIFPKKEGEPDDDADNYGGLCFDMSLEVLRAILPLMQRLAELPL